jgi:predicted  nucleic acid-binding Zn-ribbon protein
MNAAAATNLNWKVCANCTSQHRQPIASNKRRCPTCGGNKFQAPTCEEIERKAKQDALMATFEAQVLGAAA